MKRLVAALAVALVSTVANPQGLPLADQLPAWASKPWAAVSAAHQIELFGGINPFFQRGDFDGDGKPDLAILVRG
ncbi:MAG: FG-GAP repeat protein [Betaproteobacteria bacterium]